MQHSRAMSIHERIRKRRTELKLTLQEVGAAVGVNWQTVQHWERKTAPRRVILEDVAKALHTTVEYLAFGTGEGGPPEYSARAREVARLFDLLPPEKQRLLYAQAQVLHNPDGFRFGHDALDG